MSKAIHILLAAALFATLASSEARTDAVFGTSVNEIRARGLSEFKGRQLAVFFVSGREAIINGQGQALHVAAVKAEPVRVTIAADGTAVIPKSFVPLSGFKAFNYIVFAIPSADNQGLFLRNFDGSYPGDPRVPAAVWSQLDTRDFSYERIWYLSTLEFKALQFSQGASERVELDFNGRVLTSSTTYMKAPAPKTRPRPVVL